MLEQFFTEDTLPQLIEWFDFNCNTGCTPEQLKDTLVAAGYRAADIDQFLANQAARRRAAHRAANLFDAEAIGNSDAAIQRFWRRADVLNAFNQISLGDRTVCILTKHVGCGIYFIPAFLSDEECHGLMRDSASHLSASAVIDENDGTQTRLPSRSSQGTSLPRGANELVRRIESRLARLTSLPISHGEDLQILRYGIGGEYRPHFDYFDPATVGGAQLLARSSQRLATVILYLCDVEAGGATLFPELSLAFTPQRGAALLFPSLARDGTLLRTSLHCGCPVTSGEKWIATKWLRLLSHGGQIGGEKAGNGPPGASSTV